MFPAKLFPPYHAIYANAPDCVSGIGRTRHAAALPSNILTPIRHIKSLLDIFSMRDHHALGCLTRTGLYRVLSLLALFLAVDYLCSTTRAYAEEPKFITEDVHRQVWRSLVYVQASAASTKKGEMGTPIQSNATGFLVSPKGQILTVYHLLSMLGEFDPDTLKITVSIGKKADQPSIIAAVVSALESVDILLLKIEESVDLYPSVALGSSMSLKLGQAFLTSGFPSKLPYYADEGKLTGRDAPGGYLWTTNIFFDSGQSGSPLYNDHGEVIGIAKGDVGSSSTGNLFIPIEFADPLLIQVRLDQLEKRLGSRISRLQTDLENARASFLSVPGVSGEGATENEESPLSRMKLAYLAFARAVLRAQVFRDSAHRGSLALQFATHGYEGGFISSTDALEAQSFRNDSLKKYSDALVRAEDYRAGLENIKMNNPAVNLILTVVPLYTGFDEKLSTWLNPKFTDWGEIGGGGEDPYNIPPWIEADRQKRAVFVTENGSKQAIFQGKHMSYIGGQPELRHLLDKLLLLEEGVYAAANKAQSVSGVVLAQIASYGVGVRDMNALVATFKEVTVTHLELVDSLMDYEIVRDKIDALLGKNVGSLSIYFPAGADFGKYEKQGGLVDLRDIGNL